MRDINLTDYQASQSLQGRYRLTDVRTTAGSYELLRFDQPEQKTASVDIEVDTQCGEAGEAFAVALAYNVIMFEGKTRPEDDTDESVIAKCSVTLSGLYLPVESDDPEPLEMTDELVSAFAASAAMLNLHPYAREYVASATSRMGLPVLHLAPLVLGSNEPIDLA